MGKTVNRRQLRASQLEESLCAAAEPTSDRAALTSASASVPTSRHSTLAESMTRGITLAMISPAIIRLAMGSKTVQPVRRIMIVERITPTLPSVSCNILSQDFVADLSYTYSKHM